MAQNDDRWVEVSKSAFAHETEGLNLLRDVVPNASPYRAWTNFEFMDNHGLWHEVDALVLGRRRLHLIELKHFVGRLGGTETNWVRTLPSGKVRTQRSPLLLTRRKAQRLATRIEEEAHKVAVESGLNPEKVRRALPFVQESVFLHAADFTVEMPELAKSGLFGLDGDEDRSKLPGISTRILEPPTDTRRVDEDLSVIIALALRNLGITRRTERDAGSWTISGAPVASGDDWQEWPAKHKGTDDPARARVVSFRPGTPAHARAAAHRKMQREYTLLSSLRHESIVVPRDLVQDDDGNTVLIYPQTPGYEPLDLALATRTLTADQQLTVLSRVAEALAYAHRNHVAHRGLGPSTVLIHTERLDAGRIDVRLVDWSWAGRIHDGGTRSATMLGTAVTATGGAAADEVFQAPEDRWAPDSDRIALDVFSLGALAYFLFSGGQNPARDRGSLLERLRAEQGLDLAAATGRFVDERLRELVLRSTNPSVSKRVGTEAKTGRPTFGAQQFAAALDGYRHAQQPATATPQIDPLNPPTGALLDDRFEVQSVLGSGSTARGILVTDRHHDDRTRVLKVGLDDTAAHRLRDEAEVLTTLAQQQPPVPGVVELIEGPLHLGHRTALLLSNCGEQTLADVVRYTPLGPAQLKTWGLGLLDAVVALDAAGITHRDIKPSNLGLSRPDGKRSAKARLALFDFSLSRAPVDQLDAGTPPYRDPFLGTGIRTAYDSAAERYSTAVVLYEMATASTPVYGDGVSDPRVLADDVSVSAEDFGGHARTRAEALATFFAAALARNVRDRFDTAAAMRAAWAAVFAAKPADAEPVHAEVQAPRATATATAIPPVAVGEPATYTSLNTLAAEFARAAATKPSAIRRQVVELLLGTHDAAPDDPFVTYQVLAPLAGVTPGRVAQIFGELRELWARSPQLAATVDRLYRRGLALLESTGGASTPELLARELAGALDADGPADPQRTALGVLRLVLASAPEPEPGSEDDDPRPLLTRRQSTGTVAMIATAAVDRRLPAALAREADGLVAAAAAQGLALVAPADADRPLRAAAATVLDVAPEQVEIPGYVLLRIAAASSVQVALSARDELHARTLPIRDALGLLLQGLSTSDAFGRPELESRVAARFPTLARTLPRRPDLDSLVAAVVQGMGWSEERARYEFAGAPQRLSHVPTRHTLAGSPAAAIGSGSDVELLLDTSIRDRTFRALGVPMGASDQVADALVERFGAVRVDVTDVLLGELRARAAQVGIAWEAILAADSGAAADREGLKGFVAQALPAVVDAVSAAGGPVVLTDLSTLAAYGQLGVLQAWVDVTNPPPHAVWALIPQPEESGGRPGARVDGTALPRTSPEQFVQVDRFGLQALLSSHEDSMKEHV
ncbi:protein kinase domain-containing protein [Speluncibacter jeojiensis]|uniref:non-specific serine/threonine protein kinase n=1 Tax=Speluncibacter jeojiensis TaxID=2710754 RepID=A0A9X4RG40_9ACTN|nr:protein kinase [Corynebacteriales bacterium D3-21]